MLKAYFDESGMHGDAKITGVGGFVAKTDAWVALEEKWLKLLERIRVETGKDIREFHACKCDAGEGEWFGIDRSIRDAYVIGFTDLVAQKDIFHSMSISIGVPGWEAFTTPEFREKFISPYHLCADQCFQQAYHVSKVLYGNAPVEIVYAAHEKHSPTLRDALSIYLSGDWFNNIKTVSYARPIDCIPLQTADLVSYESYRYWDNVQSGAVKRILFDRPPMVKLQNTGHFGLSGHYDGRALKILIKRHHSINRLYDPHPDV
jgi:hypothetical protein